MRLAGGQDQAGQAGKSDGSPSTGFRPPILSLTQQILSNSDLLSAHVHGNLSQDMN